MTMSNEGKKIRLLGAPMDLGAGRRGVDGGPSAIRRAGLNSQLTRWGQEVVDWRDLHVPIPEVLRIIGTTSKYLPQVAEVNQGFAQKVEAALQEGAIPPILGGDQAISVGTTTSVLAFYRQRGERIGAIWFDAQADMNTPETTPSGKIQRMPDAVSRGLGASAPVNLNQFAPKLDVESGRRIL